jgi:hypothetical protein
MSVDRRTTQWAERYSALLRSHLESTGSNVSAAKRALVETLATVQCELAVLQDKLASGGRGGDAADLTLFLRLSSTATELLSSAGLQQTVTDQSSGNDAGDKIAGILLRIVGSREMENAQGIFHTNNGVLITDPLDVALEQQIYDLKQRRGHMHANAGIYTRTPGHACAGGATPRNGAVISRADHY